MKKILTITLISILALINVQAQETNIEMCKAYIKEAKNFQATKEVTIVSEATMAFYKDQVTANCGNIVSKAPFKNDFYAKAFTKQQSSSMVNCKMAIQMAKAYDENAEVKPFIANAHRINVTDNCGTLVAKKAPAFCLFDKVDNSSADALKERCLASIKKAYEARGTSDDSASKEEVVINCGRLQATL